MIDISKMIGVSYFSLILYLKQMKRAFRIKYGDLTIDYGKISDEEYLEPKYDHKIDLDIVGVTNIEILGLEIPVVTITKLA